MFTDVTFFKKIHVIGAQMTFHFFDIFKVDTTAVASDNTSAQRIIQDSSVAFEVEVKDALNCKPF